MICFKEKERPNVEVLAPRIESVNINVKLNGKYKTPSGMPKGLVVHFTSGHSQQGKQDAVNTLNGLSFNGLGCMVMDSSGVIYRAQNQLIDDVAYHCGTSKWKGLKGISRYCMGMEICNAGLVTPVQDSRSLKYKSWFGDIYYQDDVRYIHEQNFNQKPGYYHKFTVEQEQSLLQFCKWQLATNPEFDIEWVVGHDEIAEDRKSDPGGSFSKSMHEFRMELKKLIQSPG